MEILEALTVFDWMTPTAGFVQDALNGPSWTFEMEEGVDWSPVEAEQLLANFGVKSWAWFGKPFGNGFFFTVCAGQADWAWDVLQEHGVPLR